MSNSDTATGPALAARIGGIFDADNATVILPNERRVRCTVTGRVWLVVNGEHRFEVGRMSDGLDALVDAYRVALAGVEYVER
jgi:hypothetical protein